MKEADTSVEPEEVTTTAEQSESLRIKWSPREKQAKEKEMLPVNTG